MRSPAERRRNRKENSPRIGEPTFRSMDDMIESFRRRARQAWAISSMSIRYEQDAKARAEKRVERDLRRAAALAADAAKLAAWKSWTAALGALVPKRAKSRERRASAA